MTDVQTKPEESPATVLSEVTVEIGGQTIPFQLTTSSEAPAVFALGVRKSGSTLLTRIMGFLARRNDVPIVDIPGTCFKRGLLVPDWEAADLSPVLQRGNLYTGYRTYPVSLSQTEIFRNSPKVFMFRDPRDALVSQYFSDAFSHELPKEDSKGRRQFLMKRAEARRTDINDYVIHHAQGMRKTISAFFPLFDDPNCRFLRYEDYVFQKRRLVHHILETCGWTCHPGQIENLMKMVDQVPDQEDKKQFVRKAIPGDHAVKLKPETIRRLNHILKEVMERFDYY